VCRWIYEHLIGSLSSDNRKETEIMQHGRREVDGPPPDGRREWGYKELRDDITDLSKGERLALSQAF
jgi:hypothetical protein